MIDVRGGILAVTVCAIIFAVDNQPRTVKAADAGQHQAAQVVPYCLITYKALGKDPFGRKRVGWAQGYGPCALMDRFEQI